MRVHFLTQSIGCRAPALEPSLSIDIGHRAKKPTLTDSLDDLLAPGWFHADGSNTQSDLMLSTSAHVTGLWVGGPNEVHVSAESNPLGTDKNRVGGSDFIRWVWGSGPNGVYVSTDHGHLLHSTGEGVWQDEGVVPGAGPIKCIWGRSASDAYLATGNGIYHGVL